MKLFSKMLAVVLTTVGAVGTVGGVVMFAVGGSHSAVVIRPDNGKRMTVGLGLFNYKQGEMHQGDFSSFLKYTNDNRKQANTELDAFKKQVKTDEDAINVAPEQLKQAIQQLIATFPQGTDQAAIDAAVAQLIKLYEAQLIVMQTRLDENKLQVKFSEALLSAQGMYDLAVAGAVIMSVGIVAAALSAWASIKVENSEERKIAKKNKTTV